MNDLLHQSFAEESRSVIVLSIVMPLITIITPTYNDLEKLKKTISHVHEQTFTNFEHIVVDGGSTDGTVRYLEALSFSGLKWISEKDSGISDAFNKGIKLSSGEFILFQNAGDYFLKPTSLAEVAAQLEPSKILTAQALYLGKPFPHRPITTKERLPYKAMIHHQATFTPRDYFDRHGCFDRSYRIRMDYEFWLRSIKNEPITFINVPIVHFDAGISFRDIRNYYLEEMRANRQHLSCHRCLNMWIAFKYMARNLLRRLGLKV